MSGAENALKDNVYNRIKQITRIWTCVNNINLFKKNKSFSGKHMTVSTSDNQHAQERNKFLSQ